MKSPLLFVMQVVCIKASSLYKILTFPFYPTIHRTDIA